MDTQQPMDNVVDDGSPQRKRARLTSETAGAISSLERLPKELMWKVLEHIPESVLELRKTSSSIKQNVDDFASNQSTIPVVDKIGFSDVRLPGTGRKPGQTDVLFDVHTHKLGLFHLRLHLIGRSDFKDEIKMMLTYPDEEDLGARGDDIPKTFDLKFDVDDEVTDKQFEYLNDCLGRRLKQVEFLNCYGDKRLGACSKLLQDKNFSRMKVIADEMPEEVPTYMLKMMVESNVKTLMLVGRFETEVVDTELLLRQLSAHLRGLQIYQTPNENKPSTTRLFGKDNADWPSVFIDLFTGSLDKLAIVNPNYPGYLTGTGTDKLIDVLTKLGKPVWFVATCNQYEDGFTSDFHKEYAVKVKPAATPAAAAAAQGNDPPAKLRQFLSIRHLSRIDEPLFDATSIDIETL